MIGMYACSFILSVNGANEWKKMREWINGRNADLLSGETNLAIFFGIVLVKALNRSKINEIRLINEMPFRQEKLVQQASNTSTGNVRYDDFTRTCPWAVAAPKIISVNRNGKPKIDSYV